MKYFCPTLADNEDQITPDSPEATSAKLNSISSSDEHARVSDGEKQPKSSATPHEKSSPWLIIWAGLSISLPLLLLYIYSCSPQTLKLGQLELKQILGNQDIDAMLAALDEPEPVPVKVTHDSTSNLARDSADFTPAFGGTIPILNKNYHQPFVLPPYELPVFADTTKHRILLIGDSESGGLRYPLNDYCLANGHKIILSLEWYSATTFNFGRSDTIQKIIAKYKPTYIFLVFGLNELYARDLKARKIAANQLAKKLRGIPYAWIGPANWEEDNGISKVFQSSADSGAYFLTKKLTLTRAGDGRHPDVQGYRVWMDSIATWIQTSSRYKMLMKPPRKRGRPFRAPVITINAANYRGY
ncbi:MAG: SGNH/GDSL hydrolase family protein [Bacteroidetes bacterium]|nr:SGNH/GDSL hydrolase family protein [Bacteroidota bacterium]